MAATKTITKLTTTDSIVRIVATAAADTSTIDLQTDLKMANETLAANQSVYITAVLTSTNDSIKLVRNAVTVADLYGSNQFLEAEWALTDQPTSDIVVTFAGPGTVIMHLKKVAGYNTPFETASYGSYDDPTAVGS
jgi:membrane-associated PAP2 superfamily phosphatase